MEGRREDGQAENKKDKAQYIHWGAIEQIGFGP